MNRSSRPSRTPSRLFESLHHQINAYCLAARAAGVGVLALAQPVEARIVYTPGSLTFRSNQTIPLDLNNDGILDFNLIASSTPAHLRKPGNTRLLEVSGVNSGNSAMGYFRFASALPPGFCIGPASVKNLRHNFGTDHKVMFSLSTSRLDGQWYNVANRYLGLRFKINGKAHYGWARLTVFGTWTVTAALTGYAYETIPNRPIIAGKTHGKDDATLGRLAQGASGISNQGKP
jgi:hypothetical protein